MTQQQAKFIKDRFLAKIGGKFTKVDIATLPILEAVLLQSGLNFNDSVTKNLEEAAAVSTGRLQDTGIPTITQNGNVVTLNIGYPLGSKQLEYYDYNNKGVAGYNGKNSATRGGGKYQFRSPYPNRKMAAAIYSWLNKARKSITADKVDLSAVQRKRRKLAKVLSEAENKKRLSYIISRSIKREGIKATHYFDKAIEENFGQNFKDALAEALGGDIILNIREIYGNNNNGSTANR